MLEFANNFGKGLIYKGLDSDLSLRPRFFAGEAICWNDEEMFKSKK